MTFSVGSFTRGFVAWGRLLRLSLVTTAAADVVGGAIYAGHGWPGASRLWLPVLASLCVYHGGMVLNDCADAERDMKTRPERPIPSGAIDQGVALTVAIVLLALGPLLANWYPGPLSLLIACVAILAVVYNLFGRGPWTGPVLLGLCRAGNLLAGMLAFGELTTICIWLVSGYGAYVFFVSRLGRMEDGADARIGTRPAKLLLAAGVCQLIPFAFGLALTAPLAAGRIGWLGWRTQVWSRASVLQAMGSSLRLLLCYTASVAWLGGGPLAGLGVLAIGYPVAWLLRQVYPPS
jgi:4-hydroxybenzoate polyprenyltransferase